VSHKIVEEGNYVLKEPYRTRGGDMGQFCEIYVSDKRRLEKIYYIHEPFKPQ
jgi:hypothetical protein